MALVEGEMRALANAKCRGRATVTDTPPVEFKRATDEILRAIQHQLIHPVTKSCVRSINIEFGRWTDPVTTAADAQQWRRYLPADVMVSRTVRVVRALSYAHPTEGSLCAADARGFRRCSDPAHPEDGTGLSPHCNVLKWTQDGVHLYLSCSAVTEGVWRVDVTLRALGVPKDDVVVSVTGRDGGEILSQRVRHEIIRTPMRFGGAPLVRAVDAALEPLPFDVGGVIKSFGTLSVEEHRRFDEARARRQQAAVQKYKQDLKQQRAVFIRAYLRANSARGDAADLAARIAFAWRATADGHDMARAHIVLKNTEWQQEIAAVASAIDTVAGGGGGPDEGRRKRGAEEA